MIYDCIIVGGGIAGLQAAIQLGRYQHQVLVIDSGYGRSTICRSFHNVLGYPDGVSGEELRDKGRAHAEKLGITFVKDEVIKAQKRNNQFELTGRKENEKYYGRKLFLATGVMDRIPQLPGLIPCLGLTVYVCPDCDGYEVRNKQTIVLGTGNAGASMSLTLSYWTEKLIYINHEGQEVDAKRMEKLKKQGMTYIEEPVEEVLTQNEWEFSGVRLINGEEVKASRGFLAFGGNEVKSDLARQLGIERLENKHIVTDPRTKMTNVANVWAGGDVTVHSEQVTIAMGEGSQAAIWIHKSLMNK